MKNWWFCGAFLLAGLLLSAGETAAQPAPPLTSVRVEAVASSLLPAGEIIPVGAFSTPGNHGGPILRVQTREDGYGTAQLARFNGNTMRLVASQPIVNGLNQVIGWRRVWEYQGAFSSGTFTFQAISSVGVPTLRSTSLFIR